MPVVNFGIVTDNKNKRRGNLQKEGRAIAKTKLTEESPKKSGKPNLKESTQGASHNKNVAMGHRQSLKQALKNRNQEI